MSSFKSIDARIEAMLGKGATTKDVIHSLESAWREFFGTNLSPAAAKGLMVHYQKVYGKRTTRRVRKNQRGGMAPVSYMMGQGSTDYTYGRFPVGMDTPQVVRSLDLGRFYENDGGRACNSTGGFDAPQNGGGFLDSIAAGHLPQSIPVNGLQTTVSALGSHPIANPHPSPVTGQMNLPRYEPTPFDNTYSSISNLSSIHKP